MIRTFLDSGVLIAAARSLDRDVNRALKLLEDPERVFVTSPFIHLEVVPKAVFYKKRLEQAFYATYFGTAHWFRALCKLKQWLGQKRRKPVSPPWMLFKSRPLICHLQMS